MNAEIIAVGTELLLGNVANLDAQIISQKLSELGINVFRHTVVGDNAPRLKAALLEARARADIIITTGGLGPTYDDMTKQSIADAFDRPLVLFPEEERRVREWFANYAGHFPESNLQQAYFPDGAEILPNSCGTAPGCAFEEGGTHVIVLPGPPRECRAMLLSGVVPYLRRVSGDSGEILSHTIHVFGLGESAVEEKLRDYMQTLTNPTLAPYAKTGEVHLRVTAKAATTAEADAMTQPVIAQVRKVLGDLIYGIDCVNLETRVLELLSERGATVAVAESVTGGLLAKRLTDIAGASAVFRGGIVAYCDTAKRDLLGVSDATLAQYTAVSEQTVREMAQNVRTRLNADFALATTGFADGEGHVFIALADHDGVTVEERHFGSDRDRVRDLTANTAFDLLRRRVQHSTSA